MTNTVKNDCRTKTQVRTDTIEAICALQDAIGVLFPWRLDYNENNVILSRETILALLQHIQKLK